MVQKSVLWDGLDGADFPAMMQLCEAGNDAIASAMVKTVYPQLCDLIRRRIAPRFRAKFDEEDVVQSVLRSFFARNRKYEFNLLGWDSLWSVLFLIARRKVGRRIQHFSTQKRDCRRELPSDCQAVSVIQRDPSVIAEYSEVVQLVFHGLDDRDRRIFDLHLSFHTASEISQSLGIAERTVHRVLSRIRRKMHHILDLP